MSHRGLLVLSLILVLGVCSSCSSRTACSKNSDCSTTEVCAADADGFFCVAAGTLGEGEGEDVEPSATLQVISGAMEGDERLAITLSWTLAGVTGCALEADGVATSLELPNLGTAAYTVEASGTLQIVCNETSSEELSFTVHDVSDVTGPAAALPGDAVTFTFSVAGVSACTVSTSGAATNLTQPAIAEASGSFTDLADEDKSYVLTCEGSVGAITRTVELIVLEVVAGDETPEVITWGESVSLTIAVEPEAACVMVSTAADGSDRRTEGSATIAIDGGERTLTLAAPTEIRAYSVECSIGDASASTAPTLVRLRPRILSFDAHIPGIENLGGAAATLELLVSVAGLEAGGSCVINDGTADRANGGTNVVLTTGPAVAHYSLRCDAPGSDPAPQIASGFQVIWRETSAADLALLAASRFTMANHLAENATVGDIDFGLLEQAGGDLIFRSLTAEDGSIAVSAPNLVAVGGALAVSGSAITSLAIPRLGTTGALSVGALGITELTAPVLRHAGGATGTLVGVGVFGSGLAVIDFPSLLTTDSLHVAFSDNDVLQRVAAPNLVDCGALSLSFLPAGTEVELPSLQTLSSYLYLEGLEAQSVSLPALEEIGGYIQLQSNGGLQQLSLPLLGSVGGGGLWVEGNTELQAIDAPLLRAVDADGNFRFAGNPQLSCTEIGELYCPLDTRPAGSVIGNNQSADCPDVNSDC